MSTEVLNSAASNRPRTLFAVSNGRECRNWSERTVQHGSTAEALVEKIRQITLQSNADWVRDSHVDQQLANHQHTLEAAAWGHWMPKRKREVACHSLCSCCYSLGCKKNGFASPRKLVYFCQTSSHVMHLSFQHPRIIACSHACMLNARYPELQQYL